MTPTAWPPERWARIKQLFDEVAALPEGAQEAALQARAADDPEARAAVRRMLATLTRADSPLEGGAARLVPGAVSGGRGDALGMAALGTRVGPFELLRLVGEGGMGVVYEGVRREGHGVARVAVKVLAVARDGGGGESGIFAQRFASEQRLLRQLDHPGIAPFVEAGWLAPHRPWFAMGFVDGEPLDAWCARTRATVATRVALLRAACDAVQHAHERQVLHRDLKPGNILVTRAGAPVLVDFGIARALDDDDPGTLTRAGFRPLSIAYASPEHRAGHALTAAADVYSLGATLYRLLAGRPPGARPVDPSRLVDTAGAGELGVDRVDEAVALVGRYDAVVMTAIASDPLRRFPTARVLAAALDGV